MSKRLKFLFYRIIALTFSAYLADKEMPLSDKAWEAIIKSNKTYEEILQYVASDKAAADGEQSDR